MFRFVSFRCMLGVAFGIPSVTPAFFCITTASQEQKEKVGIVTST